MSVRNESAHTKAGHTESGHNEPVHNEPGHKKPNHNKLLKETLETISTKVDTAADHQALYDAVDIAINFGKPLKFDNSLLIKLSILGFVAAIGAGVYTYVSIHMLPFAIIATVLIALATSGVCFYLLSKRKNSIKNLNLRIIAKDAFLDNHINPVALNYGVARQNEGLFSDFRRGNYSRKIQYEYKTLPDAPEPFTYYKFEYVDKIKKQVRSKDSNGNWKTRTEVEYKHYYRSGFMFEFPYVKGIAVFKKHDISVPNKAQYQPSSIDFCKRFRLGAVDELALAKFLSPKVVELFLNMPESSFNLEISEEGIMCLSFPHDNFLPMLNGTSSVVASVASAEVTSGYGLHNPTAFLEYLHKTTELDGLPQVIEFVQQLKRFND